MSIHRYRATWRQTTFNPHYDNSGEVDREGPVTTSLLNTAGGYVLDRCNVNRISVQDFRELRQFLEGGEPNEAFEGVRAIEGQGRIVGISPGDLEDKAWALNEQFGVAAVRSAAQAATPKGLLPFSFRRDHLVGGVLTPLPLRFWARPGPARPVWVGQRQEGLVRPYTFQLIAFDPFAYDEAETQTTPALGGGNVTNPGNVYTKPTIRITFGGAGNAALTITNSTTGKALVINATTAAGGEVWIVDVYSSRIYRLSDGANRYSARVSGFVSDLILAPGVNAIAFANTGGVTSVRFDFRGAYS